MFFYFQYPLKQQTAKIHKFLGRNGLYKYCMGIFFNFVMCIVIYVSWNGVNDVS